MSRLSFSLAFSAAHVSKWDTLPQPEGAFRARSTQPGSEHERMSQPAVNVRSNNDYNDVAACGGPESSTSNGSTLSTRKPECRITGASLGSPCRIGQVQARPIPIDSHEKMAAKTYAWITLWFLLTAPVILWDATYCFMRPRSMVGGDLHWIWEPYGIYQEIDYVYGLKSLEENSGFPNAQSLLNLMETALNLIYVYLAHASGWSGAPLVGFAAVTMTFWKTVLYWVQEFYCGGCAVGHNTWDSLLLYWVLPNGLWLVFPTMIAWRLGSDIVDSLTVASERARKAASGKTQ